MMKKLLAGILLAVLCFAACGALADDYGMAVIDARYGQSVHLREEASSDADSLGRFYTGTEVECRSDPSQPWVRVKVGRLYGYMKSADLKRGEAAERVIDQFDEGVITAPNWANMRKGPSTEYQFIRTLKNGVRVTIMGETDNHWYYIKIDGKTGFVGGNMVDVAEWESVG